MYSHFSLKYSFSLIPLTLHYCFSSYRTHVFLLSFVGFSFFTFPLQFGLVKLGPKLTSFHSHFMGFLSLLFLRPSLPPPQGVQSVSSEPSPSPQTRQDVRVPPSAGQYYITLQRAQPPGMPLVVVPEETAGGLLARAGVRAGMHTGGSVAHIIASFMGFLNHSNGSFIICIMETHVHMSSLLLKLNCVCIAKF